MILYKYSEFYTGLKRLEADVLGFFNLDDIGASFKVIALGLTEGDIPLFH
ncbi:MAG: hypothetical protein RSE18_16330 [Acinetobacter sp.]